MPCKACAQIRTAVDLTFPISLAILIHMNTTELDALETDIDHVLSSLEQLQFENLSLKQKITSILKDRTLLDQKNKRAATEVKKILNRLKEYIHE